MAIQDLAKKSFGRNLLVMKILGLYQFDSWTKFYNKTYAYFSYLFCTILPVVLSWINLIVEKPGVLEVCKNSFVIVEVGIQILKMFPFKSNPGGIKRTVDTLNSKTFCDCLPQQEHIVEETVKSCRTLYSAYMLIVITSYISLQLKLLSDEGRKFIIDVWLPFNAFENTTIYVGVYLYLFVVLASAPMGNATVDPLITGMLQHAASQVKIVKDSLQYLGQRVEDQVSREGKTMGTEERERLKARITYFKICECIDHYDAIDKFVKDVEDTYASVLFAQLIASILVICSSFLQLIIVEPFTVSFYVLIVFIVAILAQIFMYCYYGTVLLEESNTINTAIYMSEWYNYDEKCKKALLTLMERAKRPMVVKAGKLLDLSLGTFVEIIRRSYGLLAVLQNY